MIQGNDNNFYATCSDGCTGGNGTFIKITVDCAYSVTYSLQSTTAGSLPCEALVSGIVLNNSFYLGIASATSVNIPTPT